MQICPHLWTKQQPQILPHSWINDRQSKFHKAPTNEVACASCRNKRKSRKSKLEARFNKLLWRSLCGSVGETYLVCACGHTVRPGPTVCVHACTSRHYMICSAVTLSHRCLVFRLHLRCRPCQLKTQRIALRRADTFTCSQCCTFAPAGLAVTLLADDGAHRIPWSRPELLFSAAGVWLEGRVF